MILPFSTQINGKPSYFVEKIWDGIMQTEELDAIADEYQYFRCLHRTRFGKNWDEIPEHEIMPKIHTIREDLNDRWRPMMNIHFTINNRSKNSFQFAPVLPCVSTQKVTMAAYHGLGMDVIIDDVMLRQEKKEILARQDGFENFDAFETYFTTVLQSKPNYRATFKLIHWTNFKY